MQGAKFSRNETYLSYVAVTYLRATHRQAGKLTQRRRLGFLSGIMFQAFCSVIMTMINKAHYALIWVVYQLAALNLISSPDQRFR